MIKTIRFQRGLTLVELMISMALSLVVVFAVGSILISSNQAASVSDTLADSQETGRFAVDYINKQLLRTGFDPDDLGFVAFGDMCAAAGENMCINEASNGVGDQLAVRRLAQAGESNAVTCYGSTLLDASDTAISEDVTIIDVYWVTVDNNGLGSLRCQSYDEAGTVRANPGDSFGNSQALAAGVVSMHVLFGQSNASPDDDVKNVTRYSNANQVDDWGNVHAIRIGFITEALTETEAQASEQNYIVLDSVPYQFNDRIARQVFTTTVTLMN